MSFNIADQNDGTGTVLSSGTRKLAVNAGWALLSHLFSRGAVILSAVFLARELATPLFAAYSYFQLTLSMLAAYASLGLGITASRFFAEAGHARSAEQRPPLGMLCLVSLAISMIVFAVVWMLPSYWVLAGLVVPQWLLALGVGCTALNVVPSGAILGLERYRDATLVSLASGAIMLLAAWWSAREGGAVLAMVGLVVAALVQALGQFGVAVRVAGWASLRIRVGAYAGDLRRIFGFAGPMLLVTLMAASGTWLVGRIILHAGNGKYEFSLYTIGLQWFGLALVLPGMVSRVVLPRLVRIARDSSAITGKSVARSGVLLATAAAVCVTIVAAIFGPYLMNMYGAHYQPGRWFLAAFMAAAVLAAPANTLANAILARDGQWSWLRATALWLTVLLLVAIVFVGLGAWSGALSLAIAGMALTASGLLIAHRRGLV